MNYQDIITYIVVIAAFLYSGYKTYSFFLPLNKGVENCGGGCSSCEIKREIIEKNRLKKLTLIKKENET
jgi:hypothetical protein